MENLKPYISVKEAYNSVFKREHMYSMFNGKTEDQANRHATKMAVKYAWSEFTIMNATAAKGK